MNWGNAQQKQMKLKFLIEQYSFLKKIEPFVPYPPDQIDLDISNRCNLACITCFHSIKRFKPAQDMTMETFRKVLDQAEGVSSTITFGNHGEPFLHKDILTMIREVKDRGFFLNIINNGSLLNQERAQALINCGADRVSFSLDSVDPEVYPNVRKGGNLKKTLSNILNFLKMNYEQGLKIYVNISAVNSRLAQSSKIDIRDFFANLPVHVVYTSDILNFHDLLAIREETKFVQRGYDKINDPTEIPICLNGFDRILIRPNGNASLCPIDWDCVHILGNIHNTPYYDLWNNDKAYQFRNALISRDYSTIEQEKVMCSACDGKWVQDVRLRPESIVSMIAENLDDTKDKKNKEIMSINCTKELFNCINFNNSL